MSDPEPRPPSDAENEGEPSVAALPEGLLAPLLDLTGEVLRALAPGDVPAAARRLATFDRRGLATPAARAQLRRLLDTDEQVSAAVGDAYARSPESAAALDGWEPGEAVARVEAAAADGRLPVLASALYTERPPGWEFALGLAVATFEARRVEEEAAAQLRTLEERVATLEEARRRADVARVAAEAQAGSLDTQLKQARRSKRAGDDRVVADLAEARARVEELEGLLAEAVRRRGEAEAQAKSESRRAAAEQRARTEAERTAAEAVVQPEPAPPPPPPGPDPAVLAEAAKAAARLAETLGTAGRLAGRLEDLLTADGPDPAAGDGSGPAAPSPRPARPKRVPVHIPPGMMAHTTEAAEAMVRTPGLAVVVDGYNVSMLAWPDVSVAQQRERLVSALAEFQLRTRTGVTLVFDGADVAGVRPPRRPGLRVVFSAAGQEADEVVVDEVAARPLDVPVLVVSSDTWVRDRAEVLGARVLPSATFLTLLRR